MRLPKHISVTAAIFLAAGASAIAQPLAPHRAVYDLDLDNASDRSGISGISGRMVYEFDGSQCDGYTVTFRFVTRIDTGEDSRVTDQQTTTYENQDGTEFSFSTKSYVNQALDREIRGTASLDGSSMRVDMKKPDENQLDLEAARFPTQHMLELLGKAKSGENFYETNIFDGSDDANDVLTTTVIIGNRETIGTDDPEKDALGDLEPESYWPVSIAYFQISDDGGEELPIYRIDFKLYENGVSRDLTMDYGDFSISGQLVDLKMDEMPAESCAQ